MNTLVSIIIPAYNAEKYISETIESIISQSYGNWEIIVVNDGSIDHTEDIIKSYAEKDDRIKYFFQKNIGCSGAKNTGLFYASGQYIQYLDADDILSNDKIEKQVRAIESNQNSIAICKTVVFQDSSNLKTGNEIDSAFLYSTKNSFEFVTNLYGLKHEGGGMIQPNAFLIHRVLADKIGTWDTSLSPCPDEDGEYFCRVLLNCDEVVYTQGVNYYRKIKEELSLSKKRSYQHAIGALRSVKLKCEHLCRKDNSVAIKKLMAQHFASIAYLYGDSYPSIIPIVKKEIKELGINKLPVVGGKKFKILTSIIGFEYAMKLKSLFKKLDY